MFCTQVSGTGVHSGGEKKGHVVVREKSRKMNGKREETKQEGFSV